MRLRTVTSRHYLAAALLLSATTLPAQRRGLQFGVEGGATVSTFVGGDADAAKTRISPFAGVTVISHAPGSILGFQSGLQLVSKGAAYSESDGSGSISLRYLEVPLLFRFRPAAPGTGIVPSITAGVTVGARIACNISAEGDGLSGNIDCDSGFVGDFVKFKRFDAGLSVGAEAAVPFKAKYEVVPMVRYTYGLTKVGDSDGNQDIRNSVLQIGVGFRFRR